MRAQKKECSLLAIESVPERHALIPIVIYATYDEGSKLFGRTCGFITCNWSFLLLSKQRLGPHWSTVSNFTSYAGYAGSSS